MTKLAPEQIKESRAKAAATKAANAARYDTKTTSYSLKKGEQGYEGLSAICLESRAIYNTLVAVQRESHVYHMTEWAKRKMQSAPTKRERDSFRGAYDKWQAKYSKMAFIAASNIGLAGYARTHWCSNPTHTEEIIKKIIEYRRKTYPDLPKINSKVIQSSIAARSKRAWKQYRSRSRDGYGMPRFSDSRMITCEFTSQAISSRDLGDGVITLAGVKTGIRLGGYITPDQVSSARVVPMGDRLKVEIIYRVEKGTGEAPGWLKHRVPVSGSRLDVDPSVADVPLVGMIDLGVSKLVTLSFSHVYLTPLSYDGSWLKSVNQWANKESSRLRSVYDRLGVPRALRSGLDRVWGKRNRRVEHEINSVAADVVSRLYFAGVTKLVIGWSPDFKKAPKMGRRNNQTFVCVPLARLRDRLVEYCEQVGIETEVTEESYTSKASFFDRDAVPVFDPGYRGGHKFSGRRVARAWYRTASGGLVHADVNGSLNSGRKCDVQFVLGVHGRGAVVVPCGVPPVWRPRGRSSRSTVSVAL